MAQTATAADAILKEFYIDKVVEAVKKQMVLLDHFKKRDDMPTDGRRVVYPVHVKRNTGVGARAESGNLPTAGQQTWVDLQIPYKFNHARIQLSAQAMKQSKSSKGAFEKLFDAEIMGAAKDLGRDRNRQLYGAGNGIIARVNGSVAGSTTVNVNNLYGLASSNDDVAAKFFADGQILALVRSSNGALDQVFTVASGGVASNLKSITATGNITTAEANEYIVKASTTGDAIGSTAYNNEVMGLLGMIDDGSNVSSYFGVSRSTYPIMNSYRLSLNTGALSLDVLQKAFDGVNQQGNGEVSTMLAHHTARRQYLSLLQAQKRYVGEMTMNPDGGFKNAAIKTDIEFNGVPLKVDRDCPYGVIFGLDDSYAFRYVLEEGKWADEDGTVLLRLSGSDDYEARFRVFDNFVLDNPNTSFVVDGILLGAAPEAIQAI